MQKVQRSYTVYDYTLQNVYGLHSCPADDRGLL